MSLFKRKNKIPKSYPRTEALAQRIADRIIRRQTRMAGYLNRKTQHWNNASKLTALLLFIALFGSLCAWFIIKSI